MTNVKIKLWYGVFLLFILFEAIFLLINVWWVFNVNGRTPKPVLTNENKQLHGETNEKSVSLFVAILTHAMRKERRDAIRETWMSVCKQKPQQIFCRFFTDEVELDDKRKEILKREKQQNNDIEILNATDSFAFAERLLLIWEWSKKEQINYEYFLRIDDDHFLCVDRVLRELRDRPKDGLYWGFVHCHPRVVRVDEAWLMMSQNIIGEIMTRRVNQSVYCSPYGDQAVAMWINRSKQEVIYFMDNKRIVHKSAGENPVFLRTDICESYISLHGTYPRAMKQFWLLSQILRQKNKETITYAIPEIVNFTNLCPFSPVFEYKAFVSEYQFEPKLCHLKPKWSISKTRHGGREEQGERYTSY